MADRRSQTMNGNEVEMVNPMPSGFVMRADRLAGAIRSGGETGLQARWPGPRIGQVSQYKESIMRNVARALVAVAACAALSAAVAQAKEPGAGSNEQDRRGHQPPRPQVDSVLDANSDHVIDADELARSSAALASLDADGDGLLSVGECLPQPPNGVRPGPAGPGSGSADQHPRRPDPPVFSALDDNDDQVIDTAEIAIAEQLLLALDQDGDGQLSADECRPERPRGHDRRSHER